MHSTITFEELYNIVRNEKTNGPIQRLDPNIYEQMTDYLRTKIHTYKNTENDAEREKVKTQVQSARKLVKELYERRERKILELALNKSRSKSEVDDSYLLEEEKGLYEDTSRILGKYRKHILLNLVNAKLPYNKTSTKKTVRFTDDVQKFMGEEMEVYGPYGKGDIATLPDNIVNILMKRKKAEIVEN